MPWSEERMRLLWLSAAEITADRVQRLLEKYTAAQGIWDAFQGAQSPNFKDGSRAVLERLHSLAALEDLIAKLDKKRIRCLFRDDEEYPELLQSINDPPYLLYCAGDLSAFRRPVVAVVGTRDPSRYGREMALSVARELAEVGVCIVSGMARGIDSCAHEGALKAGGVTAAVLGSGLNVCYPPENRSVLRAIVAKEGVAVSEYPLDAEPHTYHFPHRNRLISGLSHGVFFVEGKRQSGGMLTVASALAQGREVFAAPGQIGTIGSEGPHAIIREGARMVTCAKDILDDLSLDLERFRPAVETAEAAPSPGRQSIVEALRREPLTLDELSKATGCSAQFLLTELGVMEIMGQVRKEKGNLFFLA